MPETNEPTNQHGDPLDDSTMLLVNPGGRVVTVNREHGEQLLASDEGFKKAPAGSQEGDSLDANGEPVHAQNELVPRGSSEEDAKRVAELQGTPENAKLNAANDPTNPNVVAPGDDDMGTTKNDQDPGAGDSEPAADGETNTTADNAPAENKGAWRFFGRGKKK